MVRDAAELFIVTSHEDEAELGSQRRASAMGGVRGNKRRGGNRRNKENPTEEMGGRGDTSGVKGKLLWTKVCRG